MKRRNVIYERARFNSRKQLQGETVDSFATDLFCLAEYCEYGHLHDEMIRDRTGRRVALRFIIRENAARSRADIR